MALRDFWRRRDEPERTRFPLDPLSRDSWHQESEARYGEQRYRNHPSWQNSYSEDEYGGSSDNPFLGEHPLTRAGSTYDSGFFGHGGYPKTPWLGEATGRGHEESMYGGNQERQLGEFRGRGPRGYSRSDERIKEDVCQCLTDDSHIDASNIDVAVKDREVVLSGTVDSRFEKRHAEDLIERIPGVRDVINSLRVARS